jgi:hypothetical protein
MSKSSKFLAIAVTAFTLEKRMCAPNHRQQGTERPVRLRRGGERSVQTNAIDGRTVTQRRRRYVYTTQLTSVYPTP